MGTNSEGNPKVYTFRHYDNSTFLPLVLLSNLAPAFAQTKVKGKAFDRLAIIWLENTDYELAASDPNLVWLAKQGISLTNYYGLTHPSQPNYAASLSGRVANKQVKLLVKTGR
ncbi:Phosphoesterase-domain-containing protein [Pyrenophora teres f. teres]|uniref:Phosphoesterase-domain-containing protein n=1 Tax=Pyrenophora teres f. teres TaxID=97479 RepID=A0A6S6V9S7_9PLEO|nr:Phosphoesterase-domain-containing protein [Pyrenophora teres f. teres]